MSDDQDFAKRRRHRQSGEDSIASRREMRRQRTGEAGDDIDARRSSRRSAETHAAKAALSNHDEPNRESTQPDSAHEPRPYKGADTGDASAPTNPAPTLLQLASGAGAAIRGWANRIAGVPAAVSSAIQRPRLRLLPSVIFVAVVMLGFRVGDVWTGVQQGGFFGPGVPSRAEEAGTGQDPDADQGATSAENAGADAQSATNAETGNDAGASASASRPGLLESLRDGSRSATERELLDDLAARRDALDERERALTEREALQEIAERRIEEKMAELEALREQIRSLLGQVDGEREEQLAGLVAIYENMRPGDAARIFDGLDMDVLIDVLDRMAQRRSAPIIANMQPERAREVTRELADRGQLPDLQPLQD
ncbi:hypothetical protein [Fodinicurvata sp. EGI_FJ10296]|uniref:hypothetical protein n=1 Tax=Fodinicurvata sp. EGI_FJ10296 TaxID=3231908 RepID=UPI0034512717